MYLLLLVFLSASLALKLVLQIVCLRPIHCWVGLSFYIPQDPCSELLDLKNSYKYVTLINYILAKTCDGKNKIDLHFFKIDIQWMKKIRNKNSCGRKDPKKETTLWTLGQLIWWNELKIRPRYALNPHIFVDLAPRCLVSCFCSYLSWCVFVARRTGT